MFYILLYLLCWRGAASIVPRGSTTRECNGNAAYCSRKYSNVTFIGAHDSGNDDGDPGTDNQDVDVTAQLNAGIRFVEIQVHTTSEGLRICHSECTLTAKEALLVDYLGLVNTWINSHPNEVVSILLTTDGKKIGVDSFLTPMTTSGISKNAYQIASSVTFDTWPTLGEIIDSGKRVLFFLDYNADLSVVPYIHDEFKYFFETSYDVTDPNFGDCTINRPPNSDGSGLMYIMNHFLDVKINLLITSFLVPDLAALDQTNALTGGSSSIKAEVATCWKLWHRNPSVILLDYFNHGLGSVDAAEDDLNGAS